MSYNSRYVKGERLVKPKYGVAKTEQAHKQDCDINFIMQRYRQTKVLPVGNRQPVFADAIAAGDFQTAQDIVAKGYSAFHALPAKVRAKYQNDPKKWLEAVDQDLVKRGQAKIQAEKDEKTKKEIEDLKSKIVDSKEKGA